MEVIKVAIKSRKEDFARLKKMIKNAVFENLPANKINLKPLIKKINLENLLKK